MRSTIAPLRLTVTGPTRIAQARATMRWAARALFHAALALAVLLVVTAARATVAVPPLTGPVVDQAGLLSDADRAKLESLARAARAEEQGQGVQLQFLVIASLEGEPIEDFSIRVAEAWKIGSKGKDNGLLFVVARDDRQVRIEVGGGLEGGLTDAQSGRIIRQTIAPAFRAGRYGQGLYDAATQALAALGALPPGLGAPNGAPRAYGPPGANDGPSAIAMAAGIILFIIVLTVLSRRRGGRFFGPVWFGGGGFGGRSGRWGGGGGGGSWGGGGGGFSGGGASGRW